MGLAVVTLGVAGCKNAIFRPQSPDELATQLRSEAEDVKYIGDVCRIWGLNFAKVEHIALANGLRGTGSDPANNGQREILVNEMKAVHVDDPNKILASKNTSLVLVQGFLPPAAQKGDRFDIRIGTLERTKTSSLRGGYCMETFLRPYARLGNRTRSGHSVALAKGPILIDAHYDGSESDISRLNGTILGGGRVTEDRTIGLAIATDAASVRTATRIANAINARFAIYDDTGKVGVASAKSDRNVELKIPKEYKHNMGRFLRVVMNIAFENPKTNTNSRVEKLELQLNDPSSARKAALRLEGIGIDSTGVLRRALNHSDEEVRFYAAESLAYLGKDTGVAHLEEIARKNQMFRWHALTALASLKETKSGKALSNLMHSEDVATRYGAFKSMLARSPQDPLVSGKLVGNSFFLHVVPSSAKSALHISRRTRPEIVIFNDKQTFGDKFLYIQSGMTAKSIGRNQIEIKIYMQNDGDKVITCSNRVSEVIEKISSLGCDYGCIIEMLLEAKKEGNINSEVVVDAGPKATDNRRQRARWAQNQLPGEDDQVDVAGPLPELFREAGEGSGINDYDEQANESSAASTTETVEPVEQKKSLFDRIKNPFKRKN